MNESWGDDDFLGYCELHSETERALFHKDHVVRVLRLAGREADAEAVASDPKAWYEVHENPMKDWVRAARERITENTR